MADLSDAEQQFREMAVRVGTRHLGPQRSRAFDEAVETLVDTQRAVYSAAMRAAAARVRYRCQTDRPAKVPEPAPPEGPPATR